MTNILITGGAGYIGSHAARLFLEKGYKVTILDNLSTGFQKAIDVLKQFGDLEYKNADIRDFKAVSKIFSEGDFDCVLHFAALASVSGSLKNPHDYFSTNVFGTLNLIEACKKNNIKKFIFSSSCAVYGESVYLPIDEIHPKNPTIPYGETKVMSEKILDWYSNLFGIGCVSFRYFNVCGASEDGKIGDSKRPSVHLMQNAVMGALNIEPFKLTCPSAETGDGTPVRDYVDVNDLADAHLLAYEYLSKGGKSEAFNIGSGKGISVLELVLEVEKEMGVKLPREQGEVRQGEYSKVFASLEKTEKALGWKPKRSLKDSINSLKTWYTKNPTRFL